MAPSVPTHHLRPADRRGWGWRVGQVQVQVQLPQLSLHEFPSALGWTAAATVASGVPDVLRAFKTVGRGEGVGVVGVPAKGKGFAGTIVPSLKKGCSERSHPLFVFFFSPFVEFCLWTKPPVVPDV